VRGCDAPRFVAQLAIHYRDFWSARTLTAMPTLDPIDFLTRFCSIPTAPFREHLVMHAIDVFAKKYRTLQVSRDEFGNTLLIRPGKQKSKSPRLIFVAHLDHPGFVAQEMVSDKELKADFRGGVLATFVNGSRVKFFDAGREIRGKVIDVTPDADGRADSATLRVSSAVQKDAIGMFDVGEGRVSASRFHCRCCDDLAGAAAALCLLHELASKPANADVGVLLTRGEEQGFIGAIASVLHPRLLRRTDHIISIECSAEQPVAQQGKGVVLRVGDRTSIFNSAFSRFIFNVADALKQSDKTFKYQRALMPGGTCEATVFDAWGYTSAALCVALGNYHNMDKLRERIAAEHVHVEDWKNMVRLFAEIARSFDTFSGNHDELKGRLTARFDAHRHLVRQRGVVAAGA
jgi:endoglucanase